MNARGQAGVTLIELVVGLTIASALLAATYGALTTAIDRRETAISVVEADVGVAAVRSSIRDWLGGVQISSENIGPTFSGADGIHEGVPDDRLTFLTSAPTPLGYGLATVQVFIDRDPDTTEEGLVGVFTAWQGDGRRRIGLVAEAEGLEVRYRSTLLAGRTWLPSWISSTVLPAGVELVIVGGSDVPELLTLPLRLRLHGGR